MGSNFKVDCSNCRKVSNYIRFTSLCFEIAKHSLPKDVNISSDLGNFNLVVFVLIPEFKNVGLMAFRSDYAQFQN